MEYLGEYSQNIRSIAEHSEIWRFFRRTRTTAWSQPGITPSLAIDFFRQGAKPIQLMALDWKRSITQWIPRFRYDRGFGRIYDPRIGRSIHSRKSRKDRLIPSRRWAQTDIGTEPGSNGGNHEF
jgi:hypothetical protein